MAFEDLMRDHVDLLKVDGRSYLGLKASVQDSKIFLPAGDFEVEAGDLICHGRLGQEVYEVLDPGFQEARGPLPANYQVRAKKLPSYEASFVIRSLSRKEPPAEVEARTEAEAGDEEGSGPGADELIDRLLRELTVTDLLAAERAAGLELIDALRTELSSDRPRKSVVTALLAALPPALRLGDTASALRDLLS